MQGLVIGLPLGAAVAAGLMRTSKPPHLAWSAGGAGECGVRSSGVVALSGAECPLSSPIALRRGVRLPLARTRRYRARRGRTRGGESHFRHSGAMRSAGDHAHVREGRDSGAAREYAGGPSLRAMLGAVLGSAEYGHESR